MWACTTAVGDVARLAQHTVPCTVYVWADKLTQAGVVALSNDLLSEVSNFHCSSPPVPLSNKGSNSIWVVSSPPHPHLLHCFFLGSPMVCAVWACVFSYPLYVHFWGPPTDHLLSSSYLILGLHLQWCMQVISPISPSPSLWCVLIIKPLLALTDLSHEIPRSA